MGVAVSQAAGLVTGWSVDPDQRYNCDTHDHEYGKHYTCQHEHLIVMTVLQ